MTAIYERFLRRLREKVLIADGAMGTMIQAANLTNDDYGGLDGCNEYLICTKPDLIREIHAKYFEAGADLVETNTFGSAKLVLGEYDLADRAYEISKENAAVARAVADEFSSRTWPRFVAGSVGPGTKLPTLGHISYDDMFQSYMPQMLGLIDGGVDVLQIETCQDMLQVKCAVAAAVAAMKERKKRLPIIVTVTIETTGTMLVGTEVAAALVVLESLPVDVIGFNCATGPDMMQENVRYLCGSGHFPVAVIPNAGLPRNDGGRAVYDLSPSMLADYHEIFVKDFGAAIVGGCCGTTPAHIREIYERVGSLAPKAVRGDLEPHVASNYSAVALDQPGTTPLIIGERCNANGSKQFREHLLVENWEAIVDMGRKEVEEGAHVLDICTAYVGRNELRDMTEIVSRFVGQVTAPLMIDSTQLDVLEGALKLIGGRAIINSINLEDGEDKFDKICDLAVRFGSALIALTIDEEGMAKTADKKLEIAERIYDLCTKRHGIPPEALIFDPLTFTIGSGDEDSRKAGVETLQGIKLIKEKLPKVRTVLGLSNISFGLKPYPRQILNSVFLAEAIKHGLDSAILHQGKILPLHKIPEDIVKLSLDLIYDRRSEGYDPLFVFIEKLQGAVAERADAVAADGPIEEVLKKAIIDGRKQGIEAHLDKARETYSPLDIINNILLDGMKVVGDLFGRGEMQLPFVLQSAETMKKAVAHLEQYMDKSGGPSKGCMVIATVKGDVHDIGKNLVDIILSNNGYKVVNLGIKQPLESILAAAEEHKPNAIGMSGLLVKSTLVMKENLEEMSRRGISTPVICGGAALNRAYVEVDLRAAYTTGPVYYGADAFTGLGIMDELTGRTTDKLLTSLEEGQRERKGEMRAEREARVAQKADEYFDTKVPQAEFIPEPPFWGVRYVEQPQLNIKELFSFINRKALYANQWMYRRGSRSTKEYKDFIQNHVDPLFYKWCERAEERKWLQPKVAYGYFPCNSEKNELVIYTAEDHSKEACRIKFPRQIADGRRCIADYFLPLSSGRRDVVGFHVVTSGALASEKCQELFKSDQYTDYLHFYGLSVETAEALAEFWHRRIRHELSISSQDGATIESLFRQTYQGERYSFGYPACPNLEDQKHIFQLLKPENIGVSLSSEFQLVPEQSTSAIIVHHPEACYFTI
jgi:5-methyltetrahydrofolate--homocysteine methyltransferase